MVKVEVAEESGSSSVNESDSEDLTDKESSSNTPEKAKEPIKKKVPLPSRNLRSKFSFAERQYKRMSHTYMQDVSEIYAFIERVIEDIKINNFY